MRVVVKSPSFTVPCASRKMLSGFRLRCMTPWWWTCESPVRSCRNLTLMSTSFSLRPLSSSLLYHCAKFSWTNSVQIPARLPRISDPKCLMMFGWRSLDSSAASRRKLVGTPSSRPALVCSRSTTRRRTASFVPRRRQRKSPPLERRSTTFSFTRSWSRRRKWPRSVAQSSLLCATSCHILQTGAACSIRSLFPRRLKTSRRFSRRSRSFLTPPAAPPPEAASSRPGFTGSAAAFASSAWHCLRRLVGESTVVFRPMRCSGLLCEMGVWPLMFGFMFSFSFSP
mmetsp:Transcript_14612/g.43818  ORF Transcript_14612/g.43818 Transcript_14612/m.43818 type:complete len:283 (+) Transcript_14612:1716-2564(+)